MGEPNIWNRIVSWWCRATNRHVMGESGLGYCRRCGVKYADAEDHDTGVGSLYSLYNPFGGAE